MGIVANFTPSGLFDATVNPAPCLYKIGRQWQYGQRPFVQGLWSVQYTAKDLDFTTGAIWKRLVRQYQHSCPKADSPRHSRRARSYVIIVVDAEIFFDKHPQHISTAENFSHRHFEFAMNFFRFQVTSSFEPGEHRAAFFFGVLPFFSPLSFCKSQSSILLSTCVHGTQKSTTDFRIKCSRPLCCFS